MGCSPVSTGQSSTESRWRLLFILLCKPSLGFISLLAFPRSHAQLTLFSPIHQGAPAHEVILLCGKTKSMGTQNKTQHCRVPALFGSIPLPFFFEGCFIRVADIEVGTGPERSRPAHGVTLFWGVRLFAQASHPSFHAGASCLLCSACFPLFFYPCLLSHAHLVLFSPIHQGTPAHEVILLCGMTQTRHHALIMLCVSCSFSFFLFWDFF